MNLIPWKNKKPENTRQLAPLAAFRQEMDRLFDSFVRRSGMSEWFGGEQGLAVTVDVAENEEEITVRAEVPGIDPKDLDISLAGTQLVLSGEKKSCSEREEQHCYQSECTYGAFRRSIPLSGPVNPDDVQADYANGVLTVRLKKAQPAPTKKIEVKRA